MRVGLVALVQQMLQALAIDRFHSQFGIELEHLEAQHVDLSLEIAGGCGLPGHRLRLAQAPWWAPPRPLSSVDEMAQN